MYRIIFALVMLSSSVFRQINAADWPAFRGLNGDGCSDEKTAAITWGPDKNVRWKIPLADEGNSSPIVSRGRVFLHVASDKGRNRGLICFHRGEGKQLWSKMCEYGRIDRIHKTNQYEASTPVTDGERVVVWHGSAGLFCYDFAGNELWSHKPGVINHYLGYASSPIIHDGKVILNHGPGSNQAMLAVELTTGKAIWKTVEPGGNDEITPNPVASYSTPIVIRVGDRDQVICGMPVRVVAYDPDDGRIIWTVDGNPERQHLVFTSPLIADDLGICAGGKRAPWLGFRLNGAGDVTTSHRVWHTGGNRPQMIGAGVAVNGNIYFATHGPGTIQCLDPKTGDTRWRARTPGGDTWASVVYVAGHLYITNRIGMTHVIRPDSEKLDIVASNSLGETTNASPAISDGELFFRTSGHLYCIK